LHPAVRAKAVRLRVTGARPGVMLALATLPMPFAAVS
jgi:hypothetical protein